MSKKLQQDQINKWANRLNSMPSSEQQKYISNNSKQFKRPDADLDCHKTEEYKEEWRDKWNAVDEVDRTAIIGKLPNFIGEIPEYATVDFLQTILNKLPNHKAPGSSQIPYEAYKYLDEDMVIELHKIFIDILQTGILPLIWSINAIIPVYKRGAIDVFKDHYRPLGMSEAMKKIFEAFVEPLIHHMFATESDQYGFQKDLSCANAAADLNDKLDYLKSMNLIQNFSMTKMDVQSAFDKAMHSLIRKYINIKIKSPHIRCILYQLFLLQAVYISIGNFKSMIMWLTCGIIQGTKLSPKMFNAILNYAIHENKEKMKGFLFIFADDILLLCNNRDIDNIKEELVSRLATAGLNLSPDPNKCKKIEIGDKWLGMIMDTKGLPLERQINYNISKAKAASARLRKQGIFKGKLLQTILLSTFKSRIIPMLEYGINWQLPVKLVLISMITCS